jgi:hypothetical protein
LESIKVLANRQDIPYQSMLKILLAEKVREVFSSSKGKWIPAEDPGLRTKRTRE